MNTPELRPDHEPLIAAVVRHECLPNSTDPLLYYLACLRLQWGETEIENQRLRIRCNALEAELHRLNRIRAVDCEESTHATTT